MIDDGRTEPARISAKELDELEATLREPLTMGLTSDPCRALVAEVRRLRSLVGRAGAKSMPAEQCWETGPECGWCDADPSRNPHAQDCPWSEIEAEALAQREDEEP